MGKILYGDSGISIEFNDRDMTHIQIVVGAKLRRRESFFFSWADDPATGSGRSSIWMDASIPLYFKYYGSKPPSVNREWLELLTLSANSAQGMQLMKEPETHTGIEGKTAEHGALSRGSLSRL